MTAGGTADRATGTSQERIVLGRITGVFGIKGWVKIQSYTDPREAILNYGDWQLEQRNARRAVTVREGRRHGKQVVAHLESFDDRDLAATLVGSEITVARESLAPLAPREFYRADLIGLEVRDAAGARLGRVDHFIDGPAYPLMVVRGERELWLPVTPQYLRRVDLAKGEIHVAWLPDDDKGAEA